MAEKHSSRITSPKLSAEDYTRSVAEHLKAFEGLVPRIYTDSKGIPTMGGGIALVVKSGDNPYKLRDLGKIGKQIDPEKPYAFSDAEKTLLNQVVNTLNNNSIDKKDRSKEAQKLIPPYPSGGNVDPPENNKFGFTLSDDRIRQMNEESWAKHQDRTLQLIRDQAQAKAQAALDWAQKSKQQKEQVNKEIDDYVESLRGSKLDLALTSLVYNGVTPKKTINAVLDGDISTVRAEILYRSNANQLRGLARRRMSEADFATGTTDTWSEQTKAQWQIFEDSAEAKTYRALYPDVFTPKATNTPAPTPAPAPTKPPADKMDAPLKEQNKNEIQLNRLISPPSTMLANTPLSPAEREERALRSLYPTMYRDRGETLVAKQPPKPPTTLLGTPILSEEEQRDKMLRALYPTMFANA